MAASTKVWVSGRPCCWDYGFESRQQHGCLFLVSVLSGRGLCDGPISRPEESYRACMCVTERDKV